MANNAEEVRTEDGPSGSAVSLRRNPSTLSGPRCRSSGVLGFSKYLKNYLRFREDDIRNNIYEEVMNQYKNECRVSREVARQEAHEAYGSLPTVFDEDDDDDDDEEVHDDDELMDGCGKKKSKKRCNPGPKASIGFKNYLKMYKCRHPQAEKCAVFKKALCLYKHFTERTKKKYRDMGCDLECCPKQKATVKKSSATCAPKPKRKKSKAQNSCSPKPKKRKAKKCPEPQPCPKPKQKPRSRSCGPSTSGCAPKKPFCP